MYHLVARALPRTLLFHDHREAAMLWRVLTRAFPDAVALCLMPDHIHLVLPHPDARGMLARAMSAYARWRNAARGERGGVWVQHPEPEQVLGEQKLRRQVRYVHLNPCRAGLARDPLAWAWSSHRDAVGLSASPAVHRHREPARFHAYVSGDPDVAVEGTELPGTRGGTASLAEVVAAVSAVCRVGPDELRSRGRPRTLAVRTAWIFDLTDAAMLARAFSMDERTVWRTVTGVAPRMARQPDPVLGMCVRVVGDERFGVLSPADLRTTAAWRAYARRRS